MGPSLDAYNNIKREWLNRFKIENFDQAYRYVFEYINTFYNTLRIHSHCIYQSPDEYEAAYSKRLSELKQRLAG
ncbi:IS3 family transposase [Lachnoclostridium sp. Marseille-P6806]|uniref:IS3 family transposase n=1 Tax=Lachnoclostridium sp. Marseille-P6806 TaxID=2364793 RepID=UPI001F5EE1D5|nr:IS3 family transposase [Lachnoclostridium sp. Marseille-P6806]